MMMSGMVSLTVDPKGRLRIPSKYRSALGGEGSVIYAMINSNGCLNIISQEKANEIISKLSKVVSIAVTERSTAARLILSSVSELKEDGQDKAITFHLGDQVSYHGAEGIILRFENRKAYITGADGQAMKSADGSDAIPLSDLQIVKQASGIVYTAIASRNAALR